MWLTTIQLLTMLVVAQLCWPRKTATPLPLKVAYRSADLIFRNNLICKLWQQPLGFYNYCVLKTARAFCGSWFRFGHAGELESLRIYTSIMGYSVELYAATTFQTTVQLYFYLTNMLFLSQSWSMQLYLNRYGHKLQWWALNNFFVVKLWLFLTKKVVQLLLKKVN